MAEKQDVDDVDMIAYTPEESEEEPFNTAIDDTSEDPTIVMGKPITTTFISDDVLIMYLIMIESITEYLSQCAID